MDEKKTVMAHRVLMNNRQTGNFSGVLDVLSFDVSEILLETEQGMLLIKGTDLHVNRLSLEKGAKKYVLEDCMGIFGKMLLSGATSFWETGYGDEDFDDAGSLCHGWSSVACYVLDTLFPQK